MCLTGVDYFSTLGYQPGIAALAAASLAPMATLVLVLITLFGALPMYRRVAAESPHGDGSISMLERQLSWWQGKILVLILISFVLTAFVVTITLSASDATAHIEENPFGRVSGRLRGAGHAGLDLPAGHHLPARLLRGDRRRGRHRGALPRPQRRGPRPRLLGDRAAPVLCSRTGAPPSPRVQQPAGHGADRVLPLPALGAGALRVRDRGRGHAAGEGLRHRRPATPECRIRNTGSLLTVAAAIMSVLLISSSLRHHPLIPHEAFEEGGEAYGRALAFLAHEYLGDIFGTLYDVSTILILWFAGASAMAGLLNIVPRYLPRYGMAPDWARATRPLVIVYTLICFAVTILFRADINAQAGPYATGVLAVITSASVAVFLSEWRKKDQGRSSGSAAYADLPLRAPQHDRRESQRVEDGDRLLRHDRRHLPDLPGVRSTELRTTEVDFDERPNASSGRRPTWHRCASSPITRTSGTPANICSRSGASARPAISRRAIR